MVDFIDMVILDFLMSRFTLCALSLCNTDQIQTLIVLNILAKRGGTHGVMVVEEVGVL